MSRFSRAVHHFEPWPKNLQKDEISDFLVRLAQKRALQGWVLFPFSDRHALLLAEHREVLARYYTLSSPPLEMLQPICDKRLISALAREAGVATPRTWVPGSLDNLKALDLDYPVVLKPATAEQYLKATRKKACLAHNPKELEQHFEAMSRVVGAPEVILQEFLTGPSRNLFSFAGYFADGEPVTGLSARRRRQRPSDFGHYSTFVEAVEKPELRELSRQLLRRIGYTGIAEVEFMWNERQARFELLEVNPRFWAWNGLANAAGLDLPYVVYARALGEMPPPGVARTGVKWVRLPGDLRAAAQEIRAGRLSIPQYLASLRGPLACSIFSLNDPLPALVELLVSRWAQLRELLSAGYARLVRHRRP